MTEVTHTWVHISEGTEVLAWSFHSLDDAVAFRKTYGDDEDADGNRRGVDELPPLPDGWDQRDNHETDAWVLIAGKVDAVDGIEPGVFRPNGTLFVEEPRA